MAPESTPRPSEAVAVPRTAQGAIDRAKWSEMMAACKHDVSMFTVEGRDGLMCKRCKMVLHY